MEALEADGEEFPQKVTERKYERKEIRTLENTLRRINIPNYILNRQTEKMVEKIIMKLI